MYKYGMTETNFWEIIKSCGWPVKSEDAIKKLLIKTLTPEEAKDFVATFAALKKTVVMIFLLMLSGWAKKSTMQHCEILI